MLAILSGYEYDNKKFFKGECMMTLGDKLSKLRRENNYTQEQLAEKLGRVLLVDFRRGRRSANGKATFHTPKPIS